MFSATLHLSTHHRQIPKLPGPLEFSASPIHWSCNTGQDQQHPSSRSFAFSPSYTALVVGLSARMNWWYSTRCDLYRSVRNDVKLTKCHEMLWCEAAWGQLWPILCYEAGHKWTQPTLQCTSCAVCIGRHNCRHYNWLAAVSVLGCLQKQKKTLLSPFAF